MAYCSSFSWSRDPLAPDIHAYLKLKEFSFPAFYGVSKQLNERRYLVDWLSVVCERLGLSDVTHHLSVCLLDYFMEDCDIEHGRLHLASLSCLLLAAKLEECDMCVPDLSDLNRLIPCPRETYLPHSYTHRDYLSMELRILKHFDWSIAKVTCVHYLDYYTSYAVHEDDLMDGLVPVDPATLRPCCLQFIKYFLDLSLQDSRFRAFRPSAVAASCIVASRVTLHLAPIWPHRLKVVTESCIEELQTCVCDLLSCSELAVHIVEDLKDTLTVEGMKDTCISNDLKDTGTSKDMKETSMIEGIKDTCITEVMDTYIPTRND